MAKEVQINLPEDLAGSLHQKLTMSSLLERPRSTPYGLSEYLVDEFAGMQVHIFAREHPPPHFCVSLGKTKASFSIVDGSRLTGNRGLERYEGTIREWWRNNQAELIRTWNERRPTDCPVGKVGEPLQRKLKGTRTAHKAKKAK